jgi:hypothetical protein
MDEETDGGWINEQMDIETNRQKVVIETDRRTVRQTDGQ